jgi:hypothetical protein
MTKCYDSAVIPAQAGIQCSNYLPLTWAFWINEKANATKSENRLPVFASAEQERGGRLNHKSTLPEEDDCQSESNLIDCTLSKTL